MVLGLGADRSHAITVIAEDAAGARSESEPLSYATPALPDELPNLRVTVREPERMEPGVTLFNVKHWNEERQEQHVGLLVMVEMAEKWSGTIATRTTPSRIPAV